MVVSKVSLLAMRAKLVCVCLSANPSTGKQRQKILEVHWPAGLADQLEILSQKLRLGGGRQ